MMREDSEGAFLIEVVEEGGGIAGRDDSLPSWPGCRKRMGRRGKAWDLAGESFTELSFQRVEHYSKKRKKDVASF